MLLKHQIAKCFPTSPHSSSPTAISRGSNILFLVVDKEDRLRFETDCSFDRPIEGGCRFGTAERRRIMHAIELVSKANLIPKVACTLMLLHGG